MRIVHIELKELNEFVGRHHRHHKPVRGHRFSIGLRDGDNLVGVASIGRPVARGCNHLTTVEVTRLATDGTFNACSMLYGAAARAAKALGYERIQTYVLNSEPGTSLKASGWKFDGMTSGGDWTSKSKPIRRQDQPQCPKQRWIKELRP